MNKQLLLAPAATYTQPFEYFTSDQALEEHAGLRLLQWLEREAPWKLTKASFYEQYEFSFWNATMPSDLQFLCESPFLTSLRQCMIDEFRVNFDERIDFTAHKLVPGQKISVHNDFRPHGETHRLLIQLNRGWDIENGGLLMLFGSADVKNLARLHPPIHNSALGFAISPASYHAVSAINGGERFTVVVSLYAQARIE